MADKNKRYEAVIKLNNGAAVQYHNINTGLKKFHRFVKKQYSDKWVIWTVRRITTKEIVGTFKNNTASQLKAVRVYLPKQGNDKNTGFFVRVPFSRYQAIINRNLFFSNKIILDSREDSITITELIFYKAIENAKLELKDYFISKGHKVADNEIELAEIRLEKLLITKSENNGTEPSEDYP